MKSMPQDGTNRKQHWREGGGEKRWVTIRNEAPHPDAAAAGFADSLPSSSCSEPDLSTPSPLFANNGSDFPVASVEAKAASFPVPLENIAGMPVSKVDVLAAAVPASEPTLLAGTVAGLAVGLNRDDCGAGV